jgi:hypothetical protein
MQTGQKFVMTSSWDFVMTNFILPIHMTGNAPDFVATKFSVRTAEMPPIPSYQTMRT